MISLDNGFQEALGIVADVESTVARLIAATGFVVRHRGEVDPAALDLLDLGGRRAREVLLSQPQSERGWIRLLELEGASAAVRRDGAQIWDHGGMFGVNLRSLGPIGMLRQSMSLAGFSAHSPIIDFEFGPFVVREVLLHDADGLAFGLVERVRPQLTGFEGLVGPTSWAFNTTHAVPDFDAARAFYRDVLGWQTVQESVLTHDDGRNLMGLPVALAPGIPVKIGIYQARGRMEGCVEIIGFPWLGLDYRDAPADARGWTSLRLPVSDLDTLVQRTTAAGCRVLGPADVDWLPYGRVRAAAIVTPWGVRLEAFVPALG